MDGALWIARHMEKGLCEETIALAIAILDACEGVDVAPDMLPFACLSVAAKFEEVSITCLSGAIDRERLREAKLAELAVLAKLDFSLLPIARRTAIAHLSDICLEYDVAFRVARRVAIVALSSDVRRTYTAPTIAWASLQIARANASKLDNPCVKAILRAAKSLSASSNS